ncbi:hypothetical protein [Bacillus toyonensis]|uniref:hypothetical protein n=1 Tax=Bacillus toyonensis TaxID=155322 RepID=UPI000BF76BA6|nr:hypothetical protein [Bacillus toyonensis]PGF05317.1 hypothetical protein COM61_02585 [Bacillus toyonensis]
MLEDLDVYPFTKLFKLKEDHEVLGQAGTLFVVRDTVISLETGVANLLFGEVVVEDETLVSVSFGKCTVDKRFVETFFDMVEGETFHQYQDRIERKYLR